MDLHDELKNFRAFGSSTKVGVLPRPDGHGFVPTYTNQFWTSKQRDAHSLHEVSYRACFKPQLPRFFIERLTKRGDRVYDPMCGRGTTPLEAALYGRIPLANDLNPCSAVMLGPRLDPPTLEDVQFELEQVTWDTAGDADPLSEDLLAFYHPETLWEIMALKHWLAEWAPSTNRPDRRRARAWIRMVAMSRLHGHSTGFFSTYTLPPNQAVSADRQRKINSGRHATLPRRSVPQIILRKSASLMRDLTNPQRERLHKLALMGVVLSQPADRTPHIPNDSVQLVVTSPPFLDVVDYRQDNWLRLWFCGALDSPWHERISAIRDLESWTTAMTRILRELKHIVRSGGYVAFEVGEVKGGKVQLEHAALAAGCAAGLEPELVLINAQNFSKTSKIWKVDNNKKGTNTNRVVLFSRR